MRLVFLLAVFASVAVASTCLNNPLYNIAKSYFQLSDVQDLTDPASHADFPICTALNGKPSCCTVEMMNKLNTQWTLVKSQWASVEMSYKVVSDQVASAPNIPPEVKEAVQAMIAAIPKAMTTMMQHLAGQVCLACDASWEMYYVASGSYFTYANETCDFLFAALKDMFVALDKIFKAYADMSGLPFTISFCSSNAECRNFICEATCGAPMAWMGAPSAANSGTKVAYSDSGYRTVTVGKTSGLEGTKDPSSSAVSDFVLSALMQGLNVLATML